MIVEILAISRQAEHFMCSTIFISFEIQQVGTLKWKSCLQHLNTSKSIKLNTHVANTILTFYQASQSTGKTFIIN